MKHIKVLLSALLVALVLVGCKDKDKKDEGNVNVVGEWHIISFSGEKTDYFDVFMEFHADGTFEIYQRVYTLNYVLYSGNYNLSGNILTGNYEDGESWNCGYKVAVSEDGTTLTMHSQEDVSVTSVYEQMSIPDEVRAEAESTRAFEAERFL